MACKRLIGVVAALAAGIVLAGEPYQEGYAVRSCQEYLDTAKHESPLKIFPWWEHVQTSFSAWNVVGDGATAEIGQGEGWIAWVRDVNRLCKADPAQRFGDATLQAYLVRLEAVAAAPAAAVEQPPGKQWRALLVPNGDVQF